MADHNSVAEIPPDLIPKKGATSVVWNYFGFKKEDVNQTTIFCKSCKHVVSGKGGNTSNLFSHLKHKHPAHYEECMQLRETSEAAGTSGKKQTKLVQHGIVNALFSCTPYDTSSQRWKDITNAVTYCVAKDMMPIRTVEREGFRHLVHKLDPRYRLPSRKYFSKTALPAMCETLRGEVSTTLRSVDYFSSTTDLWTSRTSEPYISLTIHFINSDWKLSNLCLETSFFPDDHTGENLANGLKEFLLSWELSEEKQVCVTTDSGSNIVKALKLNNWRRLSCFGHRLHIAIERSVKDPRIDRAVGVCKRIVNFFSHSWKRQHALENAQKEMGLPQHKLTTESPTRWGSRYKMIMRLLEQEKAITQVLAADRATRHLVPSWQDIEVLDSVSKALGPLHEFTDALSAENYVTVSCLKPVLELFKSDLLQPKEGETVLTKNIKASVGQYLDMKYGEDPEVMEMVHMATMLDPRFRAKYFSQEETQIIRDRVFREMVVLLPGQSSSASEPNDVPHSGPAEAKRQKKTLGSFFKRASSTEKTRLSDEEILEVELNAYLQSPPADEESDPLAWWRLHEVNFPHVSQLAKKYLCIQATSAASERLFSTGGNIVTCQRSALKPATVNKLVFLTKNLKISCECKTVYSHG